MQANNYPWEYSVKISVSVAIDKNDHGYNVKTPQWAFPEKFRTPLLRISDIQVGGIGIKNIQGCLKISADIQGVGALYKNISGYPGGLIKNIHGYPGGSEKIFFKKNKSI